MKVVRQACASSPIGDVPASSASESGSRHLTAAISCTIRRQTASKKNVSFWVARIELTIPKGKRLARCPALTRFSSSCLDPRLLVFASNLAPELGTKRAVLDVEFQCRFSMVAKKAPRNESVRKLRVMIPKTSIGRSTDLQFGRHVSDRKPTLDMIFAKCAF